MAETCCHPTEDMIAVTVQGRVPVIFEFPYGSPAMNAADWTHPGQHSTIQRAAGANSVDLERRLDDTHLHRPHRLARHRGSDETGVTRTASC